MLFSVVLKQPNTLDKKEIFVNLNHQLYQKQRQFGLATKEKENILRLLINTLSLTKEQQEYLESMGVSFFNATNWQIDKEQQNQLLKFGLNKIELTPNQKETLTNLSTDRFKTFSLTEEQKNILQSLAPLSRQDKYSLNSLELLNSLRLKPTALSFFINEEILPDPNLEFGEATSPYLPLKLKFLLGEQKVLAVEEKEKQQKFSQERIRQNKVSVMENLAQFSDKTTNLHQLNYSLEEWVNIGAINDWQRDILLTLGLKTIPHYNYFGLLCFATEKILNKSLLSLIDKENEDTKEFLQIITIIYLTKKINRLFLINSIEINIRVIVPNNKKLLLILT